MENGGAAKWNVSLPLPRACNNGRTDARTDADEAAGASCGAEAADVATAATVFDRLPKMLPPAFVPPSLPACLDGVTVVSTRPVTTDLHGLSACSSFFLI